MSQRAKLRCCASCMWIFYRTPETNASGCPKCSFAHYGARYVFGKQAYYVLGLLKASVNKPEVLPNPGSPEASAMMDSVLAEYNYPSNPKNAARAGFVAAMRLLAR